MTQPINNIHAQIGQNTTQESATPSASLGTLPHDILEYLVSFLSYRDQRRFAQVARVTRDAVQFYARSIDGLQTTVEALPMGSSNQALNQELLVSLITSPAAGHPKYWMPVMNDLMNRLIPTNSSWKTVLSKHADLANLLATSARPISHDQLSQYYIYLAQNQLNSKIPWFGYRIFELYSQKPQLAPEIVNEVLRTYLIQRSTDILMVTPKDTSLSSEQSLNFMSIDIDPRIWFSTLLDHQENGVVQMPTTLVEALWTRLQTLRAPYANYPFEITMLSRAEAVLPRNYILALAQRITNARIFLNYNHTVAEQQLSDDYTDAISYSGTCRRLALANEYPDAVKTREPR